MKKIPRLTIKVLSCLIISGFMLSSLLFCAGYLSFSKQFKRQYNSSIRSIVAASRQCLDPDNFSSYLAGKVADEKYESVRGILQDFVDKFELNMIYVSYVEGPDYQNITYIYNPVMKGGKWKEFPLGYTEKYIEENYNSSAKRVFENGEVIVRHTLKTRSGSHITGMMPVYDSKGKIVAVIGAQKNIQEFVDERWGFVQFLIIFGLIFGIVFIFLFSAYFNVKFISPILLITRETGKFVSGGGEPSEKLLSVKNKDELGLLAMAIHNMEVGVCMYMENLEKITAEKERISTELAVAAKIQSEMLPKGYPAFPERKDFDLFATMNPAKEVGGDLYDYFLIDDDKLMIVVGDVAGKGVPAALFMGKCKVLIDFYASHGLSPAEIFESTNNLLCKGNESSLFVTCWLGILTFSTGEFRFVNAGHPSPLLFQEGNFSFLKTKADFVLGGMEGSKYKENCIKLSKGNRIFIYTDGVTEASTKDGKLFGEDRLLSIMKESENLSAADTLMKVREKIDEFAGDAEQFDDITMLEFIWEGRKE